MRILYLIITLLIIITQSMLSAQEPPLVEEVLPDSLIEEDNKKDMETMMIWKLTEELDLQVEQADKFFPRFREHRKEIDEIKNRSSCC